MRYQARPAQIYILVPAATFQAVEVLSTALPEEEEPEVQIAAVPEQEAPEA